MAAKILAEEGMSAALESKLIISVLAGITTEQLSQWVPPSTRIARAMPNTPCKVCSRLKSLDKQADMYDRFKRG